ncbi:MAG: SpoIIE family protein phosphatase [Eubacterium sp.]|nr:SpoIIE family protein phosphatase [Eubacterium sp.]
MNRELPWSNSGAGELFGTERMLEALNSNPNVEPEQILKNVRTYVDEFVKDAEQFDDLTMLCVEYRGSTN